MKKINWLFRLGIIFLLINFLSCRKLNYADCTKLHHKDLILRWGESFNTEKKRIGFELNSKAELFKYVSFDNKTVDYLKLGDANQDTYCNILSMINKTILKTQIVNEIGDTLRYFEYTNPVKSSNIFVKWHPRFNTKNSRGFQEIYDSLNALKLRLE